MVNGQEFTIASTSTSSVLNYSSLRLTPWIFRMDSKIFLAVPICLSHAPPILVAAGRFLFQDIHSAPLSCMNWLAFWWFISVNVLFNSAEAPTKWVLLSDMISLTLPIQPINLCKHVIKQSVLREFAASVWMARLDIQMKNVPYCFSSLRLSFTTNGVKRLTPQ